MMLISICSLFFSLLPCLCFSTQTPPDSALSLAVQHLLQHYTLSQSLALYSHYVNNTRGFNQADYVGDLEPCTREGRTDAAFHCYQKTDSWYQPQLRTWARPAAAPVHCLGLVPNASATSYASHTVVRRGRDALPPHRPALPQSIATLLDETYGPQWRKQVAESPLELGTPCLAPPGQAVSRPDCQYEVSLAAFRTNADQHADEAPPDYGQGEAQAVFRIVQRSCAHVFKTGGASFVAYGRNGLETTACVVSDMVGDEYLVTCRLLSSVDSKHTGSTGRERREDREDKQCMRVTIILRYEHYDSVSGVIVDWSNRLFPLNYVLLDDHLFCQDEVVSSIARMEVSVDALPRHHNYDPSAPIFWSDYLNVENATTGFRFYTGRWLNSSVVPASLRRKFHEQRLPEMFPNQSRYIVDQVKHHALAKKNTSELLYTRAADMASFPLLSLVPYEDAAKDYVFYPSVIKKREGKGDAANAIELSQSIKTVESRQIAVNKDKVHVYAYGASHMRYHFDSLLRYYYPSESDRLHIDRKHENLDLYNLHFVYVQIIQRLVDSVRETCQSVVHSGLDADIVLVMMFGTWDLSYSTIRRFVASERTHKALMTFLRQILSKQYPCGNVKQIVWITIPPYPLSFYLKHLTNGDSDSDRFYRADEAGAIFSSIMIQGLLQMFDSLPDGERKNVTLSIVDTLSVTTPRNIYREDQESTCSTHFSCVVDLGGYMGLTFSPAGFAVFELLVRALEDYLSEKGD